MGRKAVEEGREPTKEELDNSFPFPVVFLCGWVVFAASYLVDVQSGALVTPAASPLTIAAVVLCLLLSVIASVPMAYAVKHRHARMKKALGASFVLTWMALSVVTSLNASDGSTSTLRSSGLPLVLCVLGAVSIIASMKILWGHRKMGDTWEATGRPQATKDIRVYSPGLPIFALGWFLFWIGLNMRENPQTQGGLFYGNCFERHCRNSSSSSASPLSLREVVGIPFYFNARSLLAYFAGVGMVPTVMLLDWAHDEGSRFTGFGTEGKFWGRFLESPIPFIVMWLLFGLSQFLTWDNTLAYISQPKPWVLLTNCFLQAIDAGVLIQTALYNGDMQTKNKWSIGFVLLWLNLGIHASFRANYQGLLLGGFVTLLVFPGIAAVIFGMISVFKDRKRGDYWMQHKMTENPNPIVYSVGLAFFMFGWILLSQAFAMDEGS